MEGTQGMRGFVEAARTHMVTWVHCFPLRQGAYPQPCRLPLGPYAPWVISLPQTPQAAGRT